ncbi:MAG: nickel pincer cofactor biosynthesis protein LarB [Verrucomicrobiota bacterium]
MNQKDILTRVSEGRMTVDEAMEELRPGRTLNLGFACLDLDRPRRCGVPEFIFCEGKTPEQVVDIIRAFKEAGQNVLASRASRELFDRVAEAHPEAEYHEAARTITLDVAGWPERKGQVAVVCAGTSDLSVGEEAAIVAESMGAKVERVTDVGVAGLHRLMDRIEILRASRVLVVVAGMEGALPSVVGGLVDRPMIAVPTQIGYGFNFEGLSALLAMLNSCVPGITVVNVDNGLGAGVAAAMINRVGDETP